MGSSVSRRHLYYSHSHIESTGRIFAASTDTNLCHGDPPAAAAERAARLRGGGTVRKLREGRRRTRLDAVGDQSPSTPVGARLRPAAVSPSRCRELSLTDAGRDFLATVRTALHQLSVGFERLAPYKEPQSVIVSCDAAFARYWLLPRLPAFRELHPRIAVWLDTSEQLLDFERPEVEIVVGRLRAAGVASIEETLFDDYLTPGGRRRNPSEPEWSLDDLAGGLPKVPGDRVAHPRLHGIRAREAAAEYRDELAVYRVRYPLGRISC